jgi:hypothetical protein
MLDKFFSVIVLILSVAGAGGCTYLFWKYYESHGVDLLERATTSKVDIFGRKLVYAIVILILSFMVIAFILLSLFGL